MWATRSAPQSFYACYGPDRRARARVLRPRSHTGRIYPPYSHTFSSLACSSIFEKKNETTCPVYRLEGDRSFAVSLSLGKHRDTEAQRTLWDKTNKEVTSFKMVAFVFSGTSQPSSPRWPTSCKGPIFKTRQHYIDRNERVRADI